jgi:aminopeptidase N
VAFGLYDRGADGAAVLRRRVEVDVDGARTEVPELRDEPAADLLLLNDGDLTFAKVRLDGTSAAAVPTVLPALRDPLSRAVVWTSMIDAVRDAERPVGDLVDLLAAALPAETEVIVVADALAQTRGLIDRYLEPAARSAALAQVATVCDALACSPDAGASHRLAAMRALVDASVDAPRLLGWLSGVDVPDGIEVDEELRWRVVHRLAVLGAVDGDRIAAELAADRSAAGVEWAARAEAARPDPLAKAAAWEAVINDDSLSNRLLEAKGRALFQPEQIDLTAPYVERFFLEMPAAARRRTPFAAERLADLAFPRYHVSPHTRSLAAAMLAQGDLPPVLRRVVIDNDDDLRLALAARAR